MSDQTNKIGALETASRILRDVHENGDRGVTELSKELDLPKSTVYSQLKTLTEEGFLVKRGGKYRIGLRMLDMAERRRRSIDIYSVGKEEVDALAQETGENANMLVEERGEGVYVHTAMGERAVHLGTYPGCRVGLHYTALGKAILAYLPEERISEIIDQHGLPSNGYNTITDEDELYRELEAIRERGYAFDDEESSEGIRCVAAVVRKEDHPVGAISVSGPLARLQGERFHEEIPELVVNASGIIALKLKHVE